MQSPPFAALRAPSDAYGIVIMSASAGGIEAVTTVLGALGADFPVPIVIVLHHAAGRSPMLAHILARATSLQLCEAVDGDELRRGSVYLAPSDRHMSITPEHTIASSDQHRINYMKSSSDPLLESVRTEFGSRAIAVILTGTGKDGAEGAKKLHDAGGMVIAQDEATARHFGMPGAAIKIGAVTKVLPLLEIGPTLVSLTLGPSPQDPSAD